MVGSVQILLTLLTASAAIGGVVSAAEPLPQLGELETANETAVADSETDRSNVRVDDTVTLVDYRWDADAEVFKLTFESDRPRRVTITESIQQPEGAGTFEIRQDRLEDGLTELAIPAEPSGGEVAVSITTSASTRQGSGVYVSTGISESEGGPWSTTSSEAGWFGGLSVALTMLVGAAWQAKRRDYESPEGYE